MATGSPGGSRPMPRDSASSIAISVPSASIETTNMDPDRLGLGHGQQRLQAFVAPGARLLEAAPGLRHVAEVVAVDPDDAGVDVARHLVRRRDVGGPDA